MQVGKLFIRVIPQNRNRGFMLVAGFDAAVNQTTMVRYVTLQGITQAVLDKGIKEITAMLGAKEVVDVTKDDVYKKLTRLFEQQANNGVQLARWTY
jgi:hypothetical protein